MAKCAPSALHLQTTVQVADSFIAKSRTIAVRLISMALTGYYRTLRRPRAHRPLSMMKYDPVGMSAISPNIPLDRSTRRLARVVRRDKWTALAEQRRAGSRQT